MSLEQETINKLTAAGYEAYLVTKENYDVLEGSLQTDFSEMGLDPNGSYFVVIDGGTDRSSSNFSYNYEGVTYTMRYVTVTPSVNGLSSRDTIDLVHKINASSALDVIDKNLSTISYYQNIYGNNIPLGGAIQLGTPGSLLMATNGYINFTQNGDISFTVTSDWNEKYIQVLDPATYTWKNRASVEYVTISYYITYSDYHSLSGGEVTYHTNSIYNYHYSLNYSDSEWLKEFAAISQQTNSCKQDIIDYVVYRLNNTNLVTHYRD